MNNNKDHQKHIELLRLAKNPLIDGLAANAKATNTIDLFTTLDNAHDVLIYLKQTQHHEYDVASAQTAREWITECALNAIAFVKENITNQEVQL